MYPLTPSKGKSSGILARMAHLKEQRNLIKALSNFHEKSVVLTEANNNDQALDQLRIFMGSIDPIKIPNYLYGKVLFNDDIEGQKLAVTANRRSKIATLYKSCIDDGFIVPETLDVGNKNNKESNVFDLGVRISSRGGDLLGFFGFYSIAFEKHSKLLTFFYGVLATLGVTIAGWIVVHLPQIWAFLMTPANGNSL